MKKRHSPIITTLKQARRIIIFVVGFTVLLFGALLTIPGVPGPGILVIVAGLALLGTEFLWARRLYKRFQDGVNNIKNSILNKKAESRK